MAAGKFSAFALAARRAKVGGDGSRSFMRQMHGQVDRCGADRAALDDDAPTVQQPRSGS